MPQLRSFSSYAPTPDLGGNYNAGFKVAADEANAQKQLQIDRDKLSIQAQEASMRNNVQMQALAQEAALKQQSLAQEEQQFQMKIQAQREQLAQEAALKATEFEIQKAYQQQIAGLRGREVGAQEEKIRMAAAESERMLKDRADADTYKNMIQQSGGTLEESERAAASRFPGAYPPSAIANLTREPGRSGGWTDLQPPKAVEIEGGGGAKVFQSGPNSWANVPSTLQQDYGAVREIPERPGEELVGRRIMTKPEFDGFKRLETKLDNLEKDIKTDKWNAHRQSIRKEAEGSELSSGDKSRIKEFKDQMKILEDLRKEYEPLAKKFYSSGSSGAEVPAGVDRGTNAPQKRIRINFKDLQ